MIHHVVMCDLRRDADPGEWAAIMAGLAGLVGQIDGFLGFDAGRNLDFEAKSPDHDAGFICRFHDKAAVERYATDPRHVALGTRLVALCRGGGEGIRVYDLDTGSCAAA
ncbi:Dabb family protein [Shimia biformata]|uniref:Dabb family protein n=1 Tax=Shimia biformata TaxID=1294299 RepID=UPI003083F2BC